MRIRGVIEGFYGQPWSHAERLDLIEFCGRHGLNTWVHAPKDDPYHRRRWRDRYTDDELEQLADLARHAERHGVEFVYALAPGVSVCYSSEADWEAVVAKCEQVRSAGIRSFQLLWDDIEHTLHCAEDEALYGHEARPIAAGQAVLCNRFATEFQQPGPLVICPTGYAGTGDSPYRQILGSRLDPQIVAYWTGPEVVSLAIGREELDAAVERFRGRALLLWDNYPANDFAPETLNLAPYRGRDPRLADGGLHGVVANAMVQAVPSKLPLATIAEWLRDPVAYDPVRAYEEALNALAAEVVEALRSLASGPAPIAPPDGVAGLVDALAPGVDAPTALALLEPFA